MDAHAWLAREIPKVGNAQAPRNYLLSNIPGDERAEQIRALCTKAQLEDLAERFVADGFTAAQVQEILFDALAAQSREDISKGIIAAPQPKADPAPEPPAAARPTSAQPAAAHKRVPPNVARDLREELEELTNVRLAGPVGLCGVPMLLSPAMTR